MKNVRKRLTIAGLTLFLLIGFSTHANAGFWGWSSSSNGCRTYYVCWIAVETQCIQEVCPDNRNTYWFKQVVSTPSASRKADADVFSATPYTVHLVARVNSSSTLQSAKILLNGRTVLRRDQISIRQDRNLPQYLISFELDLLSLENTLNLYTENEFVSTVSEERVLRLKQVETGLEKYKPNLYVLSVGVSKHTIPAFSLTYADKDASAISNMYKAQDKVLVFIDACHSGKLGTNLLAKRGDTDLLEAIRMLAKEENGVVIMAASTGKESSFESAEWQHGAFTLALLEGMNEGKADLNEDGIVNIREIDYYVAERVKILTGGKQHPTTQKPSVVSEFPLIQTSKQKN